MDVNCPLANCGHITVNKIEHFLHEAGECVEALYRGRHSQGPVRVRGLELGPCTDTHD